MDKLKEIIAFILREYPVKGDLSNARVTKLIYLSDWHQAIHYDRQISSIDWYFDNFGPYVPDVQNKVNECPDLFKAEHTINMFGKPKTVFSLIKENYQVHLEAREESSLRHVIKETSALNWDTFIKLVYSTYPIISSDRYSNLNLTEKSREYISPEQPQ